MSIESWLVMSGGLTAVLDTDIPLPIATDDIALITDADDQPDLLSIFEGWIARHDLEISKPGPDGSYDWRNGPDGFFD